jgi:hypothetical protein
LHDRIERCPEEAGDGKRLEDLPFSIVVRGFNGIKTA